MIATFVYLFIYLYIHNLCQRPAKPTDLVSGTNLILVLVEIWVYLSFACVQFSLKFTKTRVKSFNM